MVTKYIPVAIVSAIGRNRPRDIASSPGYKQEEKSHIILRGEHL